MTPLVLVVDDDPRLRATLERELRHAGFAVATAGGGREALTLSRQLRPAAVVLDVTMPDLDGRAVCEQLRADGARFPVLMLSARADVGERVAGLRAGADDYLVKPFALVELTARLEALLRRAARIEAEEDLEPLVAGEVVVDLGTRTVRCRGRDIPTTRREFDLLATLVRNGGIVLSRQRLLELVWGYDWPVNGNVVDVFVSYLRRKLEADGGPRVLHTVRGVGFMFRP